MKLEKTIRIYDDDGKTCRAVRVELLATPDELGSLPFNPYAEELSITAIGGVILPKHSSAPVVVPLPGLDSVARPASPAPATSAHERAAPAVEVFVSGSPRRRRGKSVVSSQFLSDVDKVGSKVKADALRIWRALEPWYTWHNEEAGWNYLANRGFRPPNEIRNIAQFFTDRFLYLKAACLITRNGRSVKKVEGIDEDTAVEMLAAQEPLYSKKKKVSA